MHVQKASLERNSKEKGQNPVLMWEVSSNRSHPEHEYCYTKLNRTTFKYY